MTIVNDFLYIVELLNASDTDVESGLSEPSWEEFRDMLMQHRPRKNKNGPGFMPVMMKPEHEWQLILPKPGKTHAPHYRGDINVEAITALVVDLDKPGALEKAEQVFEGYEYIVHSTHNFTPETPWKYRMVVRLAEPISAEDWPNCFDSLKSVINLDPSCRNPSRFYYFPSHATDCNITPRSFYRMGRAISRDDILGMASAEFKANPSPIRLRTMSTQPSGKIRARRHFSGKMISHYDRLPKVLSFGRADYEARHQYSIDEYKKDHSRHNLALSITSREYTALGPRADLRSMLLFIYQVAAEYDRPMESGNTPDELPDMILSAMQKFAPEAYEKTLADHGEHTIRWVIDEICWAQDNYAYLHERPLPKENVEQQRDSTYEGYRQRHRAALRSYVKNGNHHDLFTHVLAQELRNSDPNYNDLASTLIRYCRGYLTNISKQSSGASDVQSLDLLRAFADGIKAGNKGLDAIEATRQTFMRSALIVEISRQKKALDAASSALTP